jgi:hypothetical protein
MPVADEISEEGFGYFRGTWYLGHVPVADAQSAVRYEAGVIAWLEESASSAETFELLASAIEKHDVELLPDGLRATAIKLGITEYISDDPYEDPGPLADLEIGVSGLVHALSAMRCLTAASCRSHSTDRSWSDVPIVFFAAPEWRVHILAEIIGCEGCGLAADRDMLTIYGASIRDMHRLAERILLERGRFRRKPADRRERPAGTATSVHDQMQLFPAPRQVR